MSKVFISHQKKDSEIAKDVANKIHLNDIETFLDVYDPFTGSSATPLDEYIIDVLGKCTHLLVILSKNTQESWWVPFEIGIATEKDIPIANYFHNTIDIPQYLKNWPYLEDYTDLHKYCKLIKTSKSTLLFEHKIAGLEPRYSEVFHRELKTSLGQK